MLRIITGVSDVLVIFTSTKTTWENGNDLEIRDRNDYYPFGMSFLKPFGQVSVYDPMAIPYNYKYNGKELQETGMYDYGARFYMPDLGRFGMYDPLAEKTLEPYAYVYNNPISMIDPTGMEGESSDSGEVVKPATEVVEDLEKMEEWLLLAAIHLLKELVLTARDMMEVLKVLVRVRMEI